MKRQFFLVLAVSVLFLGACGTGIDDRIADSTEINQTNSTGIEQLAETDTKADVSVDESENVTTIDAYEERYHYGDTDFSADLTHDGSDETVRVTVAEAEEGTVPTVTLSVIKGGETIYGEDVYVNYSLGDSYYLIHFDGEDYLMRYKTLFGHSEVTGEYDVFSLDADGNKIMLDSVNPDDMETSCFKVDEMDTEAWLAFADTVNKYRENATLVVNTLSASNDIVLGDPDSSATYVETLDWMVNGDSNKSTDPEENIKTFIEQSNEEYSY